VKPSWLPALFKYKGREGTVGKTNSVSTIALLASIYLVDITVTLFLVPELVGKSLE
jgi:hypothetical protein